MSNLYEYIKMAVHNIMANKARSFLTMLGIIIGIASVIIIVSIGAGTKNQMNKEIDDIGGQIEISVSSNAQTADEYITVDDVEAVRELDGIEGVNVSDSFDGEITTGKGNFDIMVTGEEPDAKRLLGTDDVVGMNLDVTCYGLTKSLRICGVTTQKENGTFVSYIYDEVPVTVRTPYTTVNEFTGVSDFFSYMNIQTDKKLDSQSIADKAVSLLEKRHQCTGQDYFQVENFQDFSSSVNDMMTVFVSCVAGISLVVGGIEVMNIMLVSVTERTREIGIRKSLGAKTSSIMLQFLAEAAILTAIGGLIEIVLGVTGGYVICFVISNEMGTTITPENSLGTIMASTLFSCAVGIFFGIYPAKKAAELSPIEALRRN